MKEVCVVLERASNHSSSGVEVQEPHGRTSRQDRGHRSGYRQSQAGVATLRPHLPLHRDRPHRVRAEVRADGRNRLDAVAGLIVIWIAHRENSRWAILNPGLNGNTR